jgi:2-dehydropantoate 2-reductase
MKILVLGAGAVGGYFGGRMVQAGADVTFLVRPKRAELLARDGLRIASRFGNAKLDVKTVTQDKVKAGYGIVLFTAKAYDLASAVDAIAPAVAAETHVLPFLNGIAHYEVLDRRFGRDRVAGGVAYIGTKLGADGEVQHFNEFHRIAFGPRVPAQAGVCEALAARLEGVNFDWKLEPSIEQAAWDKWVLIASLAGITSLMRAPVGDVVATEAGEKLILALLGECAAVAKAEGFPTAEGALANFRGILTKKGSTFAASMLHDIEGGGPAEGEHILGALLARARARNVAAPVLEIAATNLEAYAARRKREKTSE